MKVSLPSAILHVGTNKVPVLFVKIDNNRSFILKMRIAIVTTVPETIFYLLEDQIPFLQKKGFEVVGITSGGSWITANDVSVKYGIEVVIFGFKRVISVHHDIVTMLKLTKWLIKNKPAILHASTPKASFIALVSGFFAGVNVRVYSIRGLPYEACKGLKRNVFALLEWITCLLAHRVIVMSESNRACLIKMRICPPSKMTVLGYGSSHGVDSTNKFNPTLKEHGKTIQLKKDLGINTNDLVIGFVGRIVKDKGVEDLAVAWQMLCDKIKNVHLLLIGPLNEPRDIISLECLESFQRDPKTHIIGEVKNPFAYYNLMDMLVFPSYREGFPNVVLEAGAMNLPVVTTNALGCVDAVVDNVTGIIVPVGDPFALMLAMQRLLADDELRHIFGTNARKRVVDYFQPDLLCNEHLKLYTGLLQERHGTFKKNRIDIFGNVKGEV